MTQFSDYERATDTLLFLSDQFTLDFVVQFASKDKYGQRTFFHFESEYNTEKYKENGKYKSIKRKMTNFYFVINNKKSFDGAFALKPQDVFSLKTILDSIVLPWFNTLFKIIDNRLVIVGEYNAPIYAKNEYQFLKFEPVVLGFDDGRYSSGIRMTVNSNESFVDMDIDKFYGFYYILTNTDMYSAACSIAAYSKTQPYDINQTYYSTTGLGASMNRSREDRMWEEDQDTNKIKSANDFLKNLNAKKKTEKDK